MHPTSSPPSISASCVGLWARQLLSVGSQGQVLAGGSQAVYLRTSDGQLLWIASPEAPMHRRGIRLAPRPPYPSSAGSYRVTEALQLLCPGIQVDLSAVPVWEPHAVGRPLAHPATDCLWHFRLARTILGALPAPVSFGRLLPEVLRPSTRAQLPESGRSFDASIGAGGVRAAVGVAQACQAGNVPRMLSQAKELVGLGDGLTPSGDDFLGGLLFGLAGLRQDDERDSLLSSDSLGEFLGWARQRTNEISGQLLQDHAEGHGSEVLVAFSRGLLERWPSHAVLPAARALIGLGHSTGWSLMAGVWTALALFPWQPEQGLKPESSAGIPALG